MTVVDLPQDLQQFITDKVKAGHFQSEGEAFRCAVMLLQSQMEQDAHALDGFDSEELRALVDEGLADLEAGRVVEFDAESIIAECRAELGLPPQGK